MQSIILSCGDVLTIQEVMSTLKIGKTQAYSLVKSGEIESIRIGKSIKIPKLYLENYLNKQINKGA